MHLCRFVKVFGSDSNILIDHHHRPNDNTQTDLSQNLKFACESFFILFNHFDIVVGKTDKAHPK